MTVIRGLDELVRTLERLPNEVQGPTLERVGRDALAPMENVYRNRAPATIQRGVRTRVISVMRRRVHLAMGTKHPLAHIFEFGTKLRRRLSGAITGRVRPRPFARPAFQTHAPRVIRDIGRSLWRELSRGR